MKKLAALALLALPVISAATPPRYTPGPRKLSLTLAPAAQIELDAGRIKRGDAVSLIVSFENPPSGSGTAEVRLRPVGGTLQAQAGNIVQDPFDSLSDTTVKITLNITQQPLGTRIEVPFTFTPSGAAGGGVIAELQLTGPEETKGWVSIVFGMRPLATPNEPFEQAPAQVIISNGEEILAAQINDMQKNNNRNQRERLSTRTIQFSQEMRDRALSAQSETVEIPKAR